ncbi:MAG: NAD-dependent 4,6-dehydratase LegB [Candidatus Marinimicrobia bacterium]|nr:NAD-dependent 4,6-dehydratase LegB [Candidatus Neomarinimicrobiota bacterium]
MKVLVTGSGGFIGSHLAEKCIEKGYTVRAFVRYNSNNRWGWLDSSPYKKDFEVITGDIRDFDSVYNAVKGCDAVFHLAALIGIPYSYVSPKAYIETNINGTYNVLQASRELDLSNVLITSTSETYGTAQYVPIDENHPLVGQSPYSATKIAADQLAISYYRSFGLPVKIVRPFNTYGPRQSARAIIPTIISQILSGKKVINVGNLTPTRDLTFVKDTCNGFLEILKSDRLFGEATNIGMNEEISIENLIEQIVQIMGADVQIVSEQERIRPDHSEVERLMCDHTKIKETTGWKPEYDLKKGLTETIAWIKENINLYKPEIYNV